MYDELLRDINECDMVLIGVGEHVSFIESLDYNQNYSLEDWKGIISSSAQRKVQLVEFYNSLEKVIQKKNYFIITTNVDAAVEESNINKIRVVAPCGSINRVQCACKETEGIIDTPAEYYTNLEECVCPKCGAMYMPNVYNKKYYNENGYLKQWNLYNKWLQGTLNKKLLVLEIGCAFNMMSLIRMPFEKIVLINQKAKYYRISDKFPQITAELAERMVSMEVNPIEFAQKLKDCSI